MPISCGMAARPSTCFVPIKAGHVVRFALKRQMEGKLVKAIIIGAGRGIRLMPETEGIPKGT